MSERGAKVRRICLILAFAVGLTSAVRGIAPTSNPQVEAPAKGLGPAAQKQPDVRTVRVWQPAAGLPQIPIWPNGAPDIKGISQPQESVLVAETPNAIGGEISEAVFDVSSPTMTIYPPRGRNTGAAIIVFPGGGFRAVVITSSGTEICDWITSIGITCVLSKYRVPGTNHYWNLECRCHVTPVVPRALQDAQRTIRLVRARARELNINPNKVGAIGFSAGGYLVAQTSNIFEPTYRAVDEVDKISSRPDFAVAIYPGHLCRPGGTPDPNIRVTRQAPPTFLLHAWDDPVDDVCNSLVYARALSGAGVPAEVHLYARGGHAFGRRRTGHPVDMWPSLVELWLRELGIL